MSRRNPDETMHLMISNPMRTPNVLQCKCFPYATQIIARRPFPKMKERPRPARRIVWLLYLLSFVPYLLPIDRKLEVYKSKPTNPADKFIGGSIDRLPFESTNDDKETWTLYEEHPNQPDLTCYLDDNDNWLCISNHKLTFDPDDSY